MSFFDDSETAKENNSAFAWLPVVFAGGIAVYFALWFEPSIWWTLLIIETMIVLAIIWKAKINYLLVLGWLALLVLGFTDIQLRAYHQNSVPLLKQESTQYIKGYVSQKGYNYRGRKFLVLDDVYDFDDKPIKGKYRITPLADNYNINVGDCVETVANLRPLMKPNIVGGYQFQRKQFFEGLKATGYTDVAVHKIDCMEIGHAPEFFNPLIERWRQKIVNRLYKVMSPETAGIAAAIIAGERGKITKAQTDDYRDAGLAHFLAISGLHMGMIAGLTFLIVRFSLACFPAVALRYNTKKVAAVLAIVMSFVYLLISGWQISAQRAFIMTSLVLLGVLVERRAISMRMVALAALVLLIFEPEMLISAGFQMSFAAVLMLVAFYESYAKYFRSSAGNSKVFSVVRVIKLIFLYLLGIVVADFIASMATLPFVIYHFNRISVYTSLANLLAGPIIGLWVMPCVLLALLLMPLGVDFYALKLLEIGIASVNKITHQVAGLENAAYQVVSMPMWGLMLIVAGGLWLALWKTKRRHWGWLAIIVGYLSIFGVKVPDVLVDDGAKTFAVKAKDGKMLILPNRGNYFTKQLWQEKLAQTPMNEATKKKLREIYKGKMTDKSWVDLVCDEKQCVYKNKVVLLKDGGISVNGKDYSQAGALSIYNVSDNNPDIITVNETIGNRYWNNLK